MKQSDALKNALTDLTRLYAGERVPVRFAAQPHYAGEELGGGPYLAVNPDVNGWYEPDPPVSGANELRLLRDTLSHEAYEYNMGHPSAKAAFMARYDPDVDPSDYNSVQDAAQRVGPKGQGAGQIYNVLRDAWVNSERCRDYPGLRRTFAFKADLLAGEDGVGEARTKAEALLLGLHQIALTNTAKGIEDADDEVRRELAWARTQAEQARAVDGHPELLALAERVADRWVDYLPDAPDADLSDLLDRIDKVRVEVGGQDNMDVSTTSSTANLADLPDDVDVEIVDMSDDEDDAAAGAAGAGEDGESDDESASGGAAAAQADDADDGDERGGDVLDDVLDDMDDLADSDRAAGDALGLDDEDDYHDPERGDEARYEQLKKAERFESTNLSTRMDARDEYDYRDGNDLSGDEIAELMRETGLSRKIRQAFEQIKTREVTETTERQTRNLNLQNVVRHMAGDYATRDVYEETYRGASGGRTVCAVMDASGSMSHSGSIGTDHGGSGAIVDAKVALAALHLACHEIGDDLVATAFDSYSQDDVRLVTGPDEEFEFAHLDGFSANGGSTPLASGVLDGFRLLERAGGGDRVMLVVTDGGANSGLGGTRWEDTSMADAGGSSEQANAAVRYAREQGVTVIGVGVGSGVSEGKLRRMFGKNAWVHVEADTLVEDLVRIYREQLDDDRVADVAY